MRVSRSDLLDGWETALANFYLRTRRDYDGVRLDRRR